MSGRETKIAYACGLGQSSPPNTRCTPCRRPRVGVRRSNIVPNVQSNIAPNIFRTYFFFPRPLYAIETLSAPPSCRPSHECNEVQRNIN